MEESLTSNQILLRNSRSMKTEVKPQQSSTKELKEPEMKKQRTAMEVPIVIGMQEEYDTATTAEVVEKFEKQYNCFGPKFVEAIEREVGIMMCIGLHKL